MPSFGEGTFCEFDTGKAHRFGDAGHFGGGDRGVRPAQWHARQCAEHFTLYSFRGGNDGAVPAGGLTLYRFAGGKNDGAVPAAGLVAVSGVFYGTTPQGGSMKCKQDGHDLRFRPATDAETLLYAFKRTEGSVPLAGSLVYHNGAFYGAAMHGGANRQGTVFKFVP
jgi:hypothetical protein